MRAVVQRVSRASVTRAERSAPVSCVLLGIAAGDDGEPPATGWPQKVAEAPHLRERRGQVRPVAARHGGGGARRQPVHAAGRHRQGEPAELLRRRAPRAAEPLYERSAPSCAGSASGRDGRVRREMAVELVNDGPGDDRPRRLTEPSKAQVPRNRPPICRLSATVLSRDISSRFEMGARRPFSLWGLVEQWPRRHIREGATTAARGQPPRGVVPARSRGARTRDHGQGALLRVRRPPEGVDHALCERVTMLLRPYLDDYSVEVSSPGIERPLRTRAFRARGRADVRLKTESSGSRGEVVAAGEQAVPRFEKARNRSTYRTTGSCGPI
jgi:D-Tyr-tRNAtyr deacylase